MREFEYEGSEPSNKTDKESDSAAKKVSTSENDSVNDTKPQSTDEIVNNKILDEFTNRNDKTHKLKRSERISNARPGSISADLNQTKRKVHRIQVIRRIQLRRISPQRFSCLENNYHVSVKITKRSHQKRKNESFRSD